MYSLFVFLDKFQNLMHYDVIKDGSLNLFKMYTRALTLSFSSSGRLSNFFSLKKEDDQVVLPQEMQYFVPQG